MNSPMLSKSAARAFFLGGTVLCAAFFIGLTVDTLGQIPKQTNQQNLTEQVKLGKKLWEKNNCMGCHTLLGEGAYYAPELTKVYERRGPGFMRALLKDPQAMYPGERKMVKYNFTEGEIDNLISFFKWIGEMDLNGFPAKPTLVQMAVPVTSTGGGVAQVSDRPFVFNQMCVACHTMGGQGGIVGPALDGVGKRLTADYIGNWLRDPAAVKPGTKMPKLPLTDKDITELTAFLSQQK